MVRRNIIRILVFVGIATVFTVSLCLARSQPAARWRAGVAAANRTALQPSALVAGDEAYPYLGTRFRRLVAESYADGGGGSPNEFFALMDGASRKLYHQPLTRALEARRAQLSRMSGRAARARFEMATGEWAFRFVKRAIPKFSLDRGFEFRYAVKFGERQCFLQSVLISGLLQQTGVDAGVIMVFRNPRGEESNNGHAVVLVKLSDGDDIVVDASEQTPFARHRGLFVRASDYAYVTPAYKAGSARIRSYTRCSNETSLAPSQVRTLGFDFLRSQFDYYRGEREPAGILAGKPRPAALSGSERHFQASVRACPSNPLAVYMLGRVYLAEGKVSQARASLQAGERLYERFGWVPDGSRTYLALANSRHPARERA